MAKLTGYLEVIWTDEGGKEGNEFDFCIGRIHLASNFEGLKDRSIGYTFIFCIHTGNQNQGGFYPLVLLETSVLF